MLELKLTLSVPDSPLVDPHIGRSVCRDSNARATENTAITFLTLFHTNISSFNQTYLLVAKRQQQQIH